MPPVPDLRSVGEHGQGWALWDARAPRTCRDELLFRTPQTLAELTAARDALRAALVARIEEPLVSADGAMTMTVTLDEGDLASYEIVWSGPGAPDGGIVASGYRDGNDWQMSPPEAEDYPGVDPGVLWEADFGTQELILNGEGVAHAGSALSQTVAVLNAHQTLADLCDEAAAAGFTDPDDDVDEIIDELGEQADGLDWSVEGHLRELAVAAIAGQHPDHQADVARWRFGLPELQGVLARVDGDPELALTVFRLADGWAGTVAQLLETAEAILDR